MRNKPIRINYYKEDNSVGFKVFTGTEANVNNEWVEEVKSYHLGVLPIKGFEDFYNSVSQKRKSLLEINPADNHVIYLEFDGEVVSIKVRREWTSISGFLDNIWYRKWDLSEPLTVWEKALSGLRFILKDSVGE